jgi:hypothetical protein
MREGGRTCCVLLNFYLLSRGSHITPPYFLTHPPESIYDPIIKKQNKTFNPIIGNLFFDGHDGHGDGAEEVEVVRDGEAGQKPVEGVGHLLAGQDGHGHAVGQEAA